MWRLIQSGRGDGALNMAIDEALLENYEGSPTLRFYGWSEPYLSLGYAQKIEREVNFEGCKALGVRWVKRPTGGRAILHEWGELTYSLVVSTGDPQFEGGVVESYRKISAALLQGLHNLGIQAETAGRRPPRHKGETAACFDAPSSYEITYNGQKLIGSAQARRGGVLLQQGTILLSVDVERLFTVLNPPPGQSRAEAIGQVSSRLTSVNAAAGCEVSYAEAETAFISAFATSFQADLFPSALTLAEQHHAHELLISKYQLTNNLARQDLQAG